MGTNLEKGSNLIKTNKEQISVFKFKCVDSRVSLNIAEVYFLRSICDDLETVIYEQILIPLINDNLETISENNIKNQHPAHLDEFVDDENNQIKTMDRRKIASRALYTVIPKTVTFCKENLPINRTKYQKVFQNKFAFKCKNSNGSIQC